MKVISIANQKGGVGKTTTSYALVYGLMKKGYRVLGIDLDPQANFSFCFEGIRTSNVATIYEVLKREVPIDKSIQISRDNVHVIPSNILLSGADLDLNFTGKEYRLKESLEEIEDHYDFVILDCPPSLSTLTINAFTASKDVIVPLGTDIFSLQGIGQLNDTIRTVQRYCNSKLKIAGFLITKWNNRSVLNNEIYNAIIEFGNKLNTKVFDSKIRESVVIKEAQTKSTNLFDYAPLNNAVVDYQSFVDEYLGGD
ncbi:TPA: ParA family protein [bacterium]|jgi:chromosome partitioning protein|nr:ParA family protein [bacterium]